MAWEDNKKRWIEALRSHEWKQGYESLVGYDDSGDRAYCCLGVISCLLSGDRNSAHEFGDDEGVLLSAYGLSAVGLPNNKAKDIVDYVATNMNSSYEEGKDGILRNLDYYNGETQQMLAMLNDRGFSFLKIAQVIEDVL